MSITEIDKKLERIFPGRQVKIVVEDIYGGFRRRTDRLILIVEVDDSDEPGRRVVKLGAPDKLNNEWEAWKTCRPYGLKQDLVLMSIDARFDQGKPIGLIYGDARQSIGVEETRSLEEVVTSATLHGNPSVLSVRFALIQLYERLGQLLHSTSRDDESNRSVQGPHLFFPHLWESLQLWGATFRSCDLKYVRGDLKPRDAPLAIRRNPGNSDRPEFDIRDPVDYVSQFIKPFSTWTVLRSETSADDHDRLTINIAHDPTARTSDGSQPSADVLIPRFRRGRMHGDLHGRNIQVGIARGQAHWPSVFDFEDMKDDGLIGLEFVKLETELKIRILPLVFDRPLQEDDSLHFQEFEHGLNLWSGIGQSLAHWPRLEDLADARPRQDGMLVTAREPSLRPEVAEKLSRLRAILLEIRRFGAVTLGERAGRPADWLREYLFLQMCYGLATVRFENLHERELASAFIAAGSAAGWLSRH